MGQIVGGAAKPKRCNIQSLSSLGTPAAGEYILVSSDNSMNAAGQGNFDCYIVGDGTKAATVLELRRINEAIYQKFENLLYVVGENEYTELLLDADSKMLESRDVNGKKTLYTSVKIKGDVEVDGQISGNSVPEFSTKPATEFVDAVTDKDGKIVEATTRDGKKVFFGGIKTEDDVPFSVSPLYGKKWAVFGDSFTNGGGDNVALADGKYKGNLTTYPYIIGNRTGIEVLKFFEGGQTLAYPANPQGFTNSVTNPSSTRYYQNVPSDVDYITIYLGINDGNHSDGQGEDGEDYTGVIPLGTINDTTTATYYGAWNVVLTWLKTNRPFAHLGIIVSNGCKSLEWVTAQIEIAKKYGIPYLNLNGDERCPAMIRSWNANLDATAKTILNQTQAVNYPTNTHPNQATHVYESTFIENFLKTL